MKKHDERTNKLKNIFNLFVTLSIIPYRGERCQGKSAIFFSPPRYVTYYTILTTQRQEESAVFFQVLQFFLIDL